MTMPPARWQNFADFSVSTLGGENCPTELYSGAIAGIALVSNFTSGEKPANSSARTIESCT